jgi:hypothetical protein
MMRDTASSRNLGTSPLRVNPAEGLNMYSSRKCSLVKGFIDHKQTTLER